MEDSFEKSIRETMENPPDFPVEERMWNKLEKKLNSQDAAMTSVNTLSWWWLLLAALLPGLLAGWLLINRQQDQQRIALLEEQIIQLQKENTEEYTPKRVTVIYDTIIHKTVVIQPTETTNNSYYTPSTSSGFSPDDRKKYSPLLLQRLTYSPPFSSRSFYDDFFTTRTKRKTTAGNSSETGPIEGRKTSLDLLPNKWHVLSSESDILLAEITPTELKKRRRSAGYYLSQLRPNSWAAAAGLGILNGVHLSGTRQRNIVTAGELEIGYGRHWLLGIGMEQLNINFSVVEEEAPEFDFFPPPPPNNADDELEGLSAAFNYWQFPLSLKYRLLPGHRIQPYIGLGIIGVLPTSARISYEFEEKAGDDKYIIMRDHLLPRELRFSDAFGLIGVQYKLSGKWHLWTALSAQRRWKEEGVDFQKNQFTKAMAGLKYRF